MAWTSWSRTYATTRMTTTTSRKPLRCSSKILRWKRMYLLLQADQRPKQSHEDVLLPAHLQELYQSVKDLGLILSQKLIRPSLTQCQNNWVLFFVMVIYFEKKMERLNCGDWKMIFETILCNLNIGLMKCGRVKRQEAEETRKEYWFVRTRNSLSPSSSRSFRTQSHWSYTAGQCINSEQFLWVHSSHRMCVQFALHHKFQTKFEQKTDGILHVCGSYEQRTQRSEQNWPGSTASCMV